MPLGFCIGYTIFTHIISFIVISFHPILRKTFTIWFCFDLLFIQEAICFSLYVMSQIYSKEAKIILEDQEWFILEWLGSWSCFVSLSLQMPWFSQTYSAIVKLSTNSSYSQDKILLSTLLSISAAEIYRNSSLPLTPLHILTSDHVLTK